MNFDQQLLNLQRELASLGEVVANDHRRVIKNALDPIYKEMRGAVPVRTGATKRALSLHQPRGSLGKVTYSLEVIRDKSEGNLEPWKYAPFADRKKPWFTRIWRKHEKRLPELISRGYEKVIENKRKIVLTRTST